MSSQIKIILGILGLLLLLFLGVFAFSKSTNDSAGNGNVFSGLFPSITPNSGNQQTTSTSTEENTLGTPSTLFSISDQAVAGYIVFTREGKTFVRYAERGTGSLYEYDVQAKSGKKISNEPIPHLYNALWGEDGESFVAQTVLADVVITTRFLLGSEASGETTFTKNISFGETSSYVAELQKILNEDPDTRIAQTGLGSPGNESTHFGEKTRVALKKFQEKNSLPTTGILDTATREKINSLIEKPSSTDVAEVKLTEKRLPLGIVGITTSPNKKQLFYLLKERGGGVSGYITSFAQTDAKKIFSSSFADLIPFWNDADTILLTSKPSGGVAGFLQTLNPSTGAVSTLLSKVLGLTTQISGSKDYIAYSRKRPESGAPELSLYSIKNGVSSVRSLRTLPEKCAWGRSFLYCAVPTELPPALYPDDWYKGKITLTDAFWKIYTDSKDPSAVSNELPAVDAQDLFIDEDGKTLYFVNKKDLLLMALTLPQ